MKRVAAWLSDESRNASTLALPRRILADLLGMRPETFSRALTALADRGAILVTRTTLRIIDEAGKWVGVTGCRKKHATAGFIIDPGETRGFNCTGQRSYWPGSAHRSESHRNQRQREK